MTQQPDQPRSASPRDVLASSAVRFAFTLLLWFVLTEGDTYRWWFGALVAAAATAISLPLIPPDGRRVRVLALARFVPLFLWMSLMGGVDVGRRVIRPRMNIAPDFVRFPLHTDRGPARLWLVATISLMPGTLSCHLEEDHLNVHILDVNMDLEGVIRRLESHMARIFGQPLKNPQPGQ